MELLSGHSPKLGNKGKVGPGVAPISLVLLKVDSDIVIYNKKQI